MPKTTLPIIKPEKEHALYGPSSMQRGIECPVNYFLSKDFEDEEPSSHAKQGTIAHEVAAIAIEAKLEKKEPNYNAHPLSSKFTPEMISHAEDYADYICEHVCDYLQFPHAYFIEQRFAFNEEKDGWGTADFVFIYKNTKLETPTRHIHVFDYKFGRHYVDVENNWQLAAYAYSVLETLSKEKDYEDFHTVTTHIYQPRTKAVEDGEEEAGTWRRYTVRELKKKAFPAINAVLDLSNYWFNLGYIPEEDVAFFQRAGKWCHFCKAKGICDAYGEKYGRPAVEVFTKSLAKFRKDEERHTPTNITGSGAAGVISEEQLAFIALNKTKIKNYIDAASDAARMYLEKGHKLPGCKLIAQNPRRGWKDDIEEVASELKKRGIKEPIRVEKKLITLSMAEKKLGKEAIEDLLEDTSNKPPTYKLVKDSHKAPEAIPEGKNKEAFNQALTKTEAKPKKAASNFNLDGV